MLRGHSRVLSRNNPLFALVAPLRQYQGEVPTRPVDYYPESPAGRSITGGTIVVYEGAPSPHYLNSDHHLGSISDAQGPQFVLTDGSRMLTGNMAVGEGVTIDGVDLDAFANIVALQYDLDLFFMRAMFNSISWAQFAISEEFENEIKRGTEPGAEAVILGSYLASPNSLANTVSTWTSKTYTNATTVRTAIATGVGSGYLEDTNASWYDNEYNGYYLTDSLGTTFDILSSAQSPRRLLVSGTPAAGIYHVKSALPSLTVTFITYESSVNGYTGHVKMEVSFDGGANWQTMLDTENTIDYINGVVEIASPGRDYKFRITLKNDALGNGPRVYRTMICTDPSPWLGV